MPVLLQWGLVVVVVLVADSLLGLTTWWRGTRDHHQRDDRRP